jgi:hypothetical protein
MARMNILLVMPLSGFSECRSLFKMMWNCIDGERSGVGYCVLATSHSSRAEMCSSTAQPVAATKKRLQRRGHRVSLFQKAAGGKCFFRSSTQEASSLWPLRGSVNSVLRLLLHSSHGTKKFENNVTAPLQPLLLLSSTRATCPRMAKPAVWPVPSRLAHVYLFWPISKGDFPPTD